MISESQGRMLFAVKPSNVEELGRIFGKYGLEWTVVGEIIKEPRFVIYQMGKKAADLPVKLLADVPT